MRKGEGGKIKKEREEKRSGRKGMGRRKETGLREKVEGWGVEGEEREESCRKM